MRAVNAAERAATRLLPGLLGYQTITVSQRSGDGDG
jgi:hypothetical protein